MDYRTFFSSQAGFIGLAQFFGDNSIRDGVITGFEQTEISDFQDPSKKVPALLLEVDGQRIKASAQLCCQIHGLIGCPDMQDWVGWMIRFKRETNRYGTISCAATRAKQAEPDG